MVKARRWLIQHWLILAGVCLLVLRIEWWFFAYHRGMIAAWADQASGHYEVKVYGLPLFFEGDYETLVREQYGVEVNHVAGCLVSQELEWYVKGYNSVSKPRILARFGKDIFTECKQDSHTASEVAHPRE
jgi:hypothetical protein